MFSSTTPQIVTSSVRSPDYAAKSLALWRIRSQLPPLKMNVGSDYKHQINFIHIDSIAITIVIPGPSTGVAAVIACLLMRVWPGAMLAF